MSAWARVRVSEIAERAGVSTATVDRVLNGRGGVRDETASRVLAAFSALNGDGAPQGAVFEALLPDNGNPALRALGGRIEAAGRARNIGVDIVYVRPHDAQAMAKALGRATDRNVDGVALYAGDDPLTQEALVRLSRAGKRVVTLCTDLPAAPRHYYVGLDNRAAGRTAGWLMGRLCRDPGDVLVVWGRSRYRGHDERESGFRAVLRADFPHLRITGEIDGADDARQSFERVADALFGAAPPAGVYCIGAGQTGVAEAIEQSGRAGDIVMIGHDCNAETRPFLVSGVIDAVVHQDMGRIAEAALDRLMGRESPDATGGVPIEIVTRENLRYF